tara:strand:+ start:480 stop:662 length:183 start_codon:yes stop_codon:yes gene_type:complete
MIRLIEFIVGMFMTVFISFAVVFVVINMMMNCQTWEKELWNDYSSCVTVEQFMEVFDVDF